MKNNEIEELKQRLAQLEAESATSSSENVQMTASDEAKLQEELTELENGQYSLKNRVVTLLREWVIPLLIRRWKWVLAALAALAVSIWFFVEEGWEGVFFLLLLAAIIGGAVYFAVRDEEYQEQHEQQLAKRRSYTKERRALWYYLKQKGKVTCRYCGKLMPRLNKLVHLDHIKPRSKGGTNELSNMQLICDKCNERKQDKSHKEFMQITKAERQRRKAR